LASSELVLAIDNSTDFLNLAIARDGRLLEERHARLPRPSSEVLPLKVAALLDDHGYGFSDLSLLVVSLGPGSFTGIRVALSFAKGVSSGLCVPLVGIPTLDLLVWSLAGITSEYICPLVDAKKGEVFFSQYRYEECVLKRLTEYEAAKPEELTKKLCTPCIVFGSGVRLCELALSVIEGVVIVKDRQDRVTGESLIRLGTEKRREAIADVLKPIYGRKSEAEIKFHVTVT
jgi:tRNA threonylcarbamoyladenosine biosynthesis protein TsaB